MHVASKAEKEKTNSLTTTDGGGEPSSTKSDHEKRKIKKRKNTTCRTEQLAPLGTAGGLVEQELRSGISRGIAHSTLKFNSPRQLASLDTVYKGAPAEPAMEKFTSSPISFATNKLHSINQS